MVKKKKRSGITFSPGIKKNILLKNCTTFKIGGKAKYFFIAKTQKDLISAVKTAKKNNLPFFILGQGSNLLVSDRGYNGLVINFQFSIFNFQKNKIIAGGGAPLGKLVTASAEKNLTGLEWAAGIPGTVGGAIFGNTGAFGKSMKDIIKGVEVFDAKTGKIKNFKNKNCKFGYKNSIFKKNKKLIILSALLKLKKSRKEEIKRKIKKYLNYRKEKQPLNFLSAGSVFKNFIPGQNEISGAGPALKTAWKDFREKEMIPAAYLIEKCNLKGKRLGNVKISEKHANFIINLGQGKAEDVIKLIKLAKRKVKNKFGIFLKEEIQYLGFSTLDNVC